MKRNRILAAGLAVVLCGSCREKVVEISLDDAIMLDAENLAEGGIARAYDELVVPELRKYVAVPEPVEDVLDPAGSSYSVRFRGKEFQIYGPGLESDKGQSWGRATHALFAIVNDQLAGSTYRFYAINGGNDLDGIFMTLADAEAATRGLTPRQDWPYLPTLEDGWYGQPH